MKWTEQPALQTFRKEVHSVLGRGSGQFDEHRTESSHCALCVVSADGCCRVGRCVILLRSPPWALSFVLFNDIFSARVHAFRGRHESGGRGRSRCSTLQKAHGGQYSVERNGWGTHEFRKHAPARGAQRTSARRGGGIRGLLAHVAAAVGALKRLSTRGDLHCPPSSSHPRGVCLPLTIPWYSGARGRWVPFPYLEQAGLRSYRHLFSEEEVVSLFLFLFLFLQLFLYLFNFHCLCFFLSFSLSLSSPVVVPSLFDSVLVSFLLFLILLPSFHSDDSCPSSFFFYRHFILFLFLFLFLFLYEFMFYSHGCLVFNIFGMNLLDVLVLIFITI